MAIGLDGRHRDKNGQISRKHGNTLVSTLRETYGDKFAAHHKPHEKLSAVLHELDEASLTQLLRDPESDIYKAYSQKTVGELRPALGTGFAPGVPAQTKLSALWPTLDHASFVNLANHHLGPVVPRPRT